MAKKQELMQRKTRKIENLYFEGITALHAVEVVTHFEYKYKQDEVTKEFIFQGKSVVNVEKKVLDFPLKEVTKQEIRKIRKTKTPSLVLKKGNQLFYTELPKGGLLFSKENLPIIDHLCADCGRLLALPEKEGGCSKIFFKEPHIENLEFIRYGFESFNTGFKDAFIVIECDNFFLGKLPRKRISTDEINRLKLSLAQEVWEDIKNLAEIEIFNAKEQQKKVQLDAEEKKRNLEKKKLEKQLRQEQLELKKARKELNQKKKKRLIF